MDALWTVPFLAFGAGLLAVEALYWLVFQSRGAKKAINRRLALGQSHRTQVEVLDVLHRERGLVDFNNSTMKRLNEFVVQSGLRVTRLGLAAWTLFVAALTAMVVVFFLHQLWLAIACGAVVAPAAAIAFVAFKRSQRIDQFSLQLPEALDVVVRGLRVGHSFAKATELVSREMADPIGSEFGLTGDEMAFGQSTTVAVNNLYRRVGQEDLLFLVIAVTVQTQTGGNLADVLARLSKLMRERVKLRLKVKALSAEGRMSGWFLTAMPFVLIVVIRLLSPQYFVTAIAHPAFIPAVIYGSLSLLIANITIYRMVNFKA